MKRDTYPRQALREQRQRRVEDKTGELAAAVRVREAAAAAFGRSDLARREAEQQAGEARAREAERLGRGELRAVDLARGEAWEGRVARERAELERRANTAHATLAEAGRAEETARCDLAHQKAEEDVLAKDAARFEARVRRREETREEELAEEIVAARWTR